MNKDILKLLKAELKDDMKSRGFKTEGQWYMRLVNSQVYQTISFQGFSGGDMFCVNIGLRPLLNGDTGAKSYVCFERLGCLAYDFDRWWDYTPNSARQVAALIRQIALPIFDKCTSYQKLFECIKPLIDGSAKYPFSMKVRGFFDYLQWIKIMISLNESEYCKLLLNRHIQAWSDNIRYDKELEEAKAKAIDPDEINRLDFIIQTRKADFIDFLNKDKALLAKIESGDLDDVKAEIEQNEKRALDALTKYNVNV